MHFYINLEVTNNNFTNNELEKVKEIIIVNKEPWHKIKESKDINHYYINIINFNEIKFMNWKNLLPDIEYDITKKILKIPSNDEERAMSIVNLMISNMKGDIEIDEIIENDLINKSIIKSRKFNVIFSKIKNLVIENNSEPKNTNLENIELNLGLNQELNKELNKIDTFKVNNNVENEKPQNKVKSLKPEEYNYDGFNNSHYDLFKNNKLIKNNLTAGAYNGKQYARPFRQYDK